MNAVIQEAQALFAAAKARLTEFLEPEKVLAERLEGYVHAIANEFHKLEDELRARIDALEARLNPPPEAVPAEVVSSEAAPAVAVPVEIPPPQVAPSTTDTPPASEPAAQPDAESAPSA